MFKKIFASILISLFMAPSVFAAVNFDLVQLRPVVEANDFVEVGKNIIFDASQSTLYPNIKPITYKWNFGDGSRAEFGEEVVHSYSKTGQYQVELVITQGSESVATTHKLFVYDKLVLLLSDAAEHKESIKNIVDGAAKDGILVHVIDSYDSTTAFISEESLAKKLTDQVGVLSNAASVVIWTTRGSGINALTRLVREKPDIQEFLIDKTIMVITNKNINTLSRIMKSNFDIIKPEQIVITREYELRNFIEAKSPSIFTENLKKGISEYRIISAETGKVSIFNSISYLVNFMITNGIPSNTIVLLLMLPVIATIIALLKQVVGITTFGLYTPSIITLSFLALGLKFGLSILVVIILSGAIVRLALERFRLLHIPRIAIILTINSLILLILLAFGTYLGINQIASIAVFPMLIMATLSEKFVSAQSGKGFYAATLLMLETIIVSLICYWVVEWQYLQNLILAYPEIILLLILVNYALGRWTGLRIMEYARFREVMKHAEE